MIKENTIKIQENLSSLIVNNILSDSELINSCIDEAKKHVSTTKTSSNPELLEARIARLLAFNQFIYAFAKNKEHIYNKNILAIMEDLQNIVIAGGEYEDENTISLKLTSFLEEFISSLQPHEQIIYMQRYFLGNCVNSISKACNTTADDVNAIIHKCNNELISRLNEKDYHVKKETLFQAFTDIGDKLITACLEGNVTTIQAHKNNKIPNEKSPSSPLFSIGVCVCAIIVVAILLLVFKGDNTTPGNAGTSHVTDNGNNNISYDHIFNDENLVKINELLTYGIREPHITTDIITKDVNGLNVSYMGYFLSDRKMLKDCIGEELESFRNDTSSYYRLLGHNDIYYIIEKRREEYYLYKLYNAVPNTESTSGTETDNTSLTYNDYLKQICDINDINDISTITSIHMSDFENGTPSENAVITDITEKKNIDFIYSIIQNLKFTTNNIWNTEYITMEIPVELQIRSIAFKITTSNGETFLDLYYDPLEKRFFTNKVFLTPISDETHYNMIEIFKWPYDGLYTEKWDPVVDVLKPHVQNYSETINVIYVHKKDFIKGLCISDWFKIERLYGDEWMDVEAKHHAPDKETSNPFSYVVPVNSGGIARFDLANTYGTLDDGKYRIITSVCSQYNYNTDKHIEQLYYTEFEILNGQLRK